VIDSNLYQFGLS